MRYRILSTTIVQPERVSAAIERLYPVQVQWIQRDLDQYASPDGARYTFQLTRHFDGEMDTLRIMEEAEK